jgi:hypothetical protein
MPYANVGMLCPFLGMLHPLLGIPWAFAATLCEGEDAFHEELRGHHALRGVPDPFRERRREFVGSSSERETTRPTDVAMPREPLETPNEDNVMRTAFLAMLRPFLSMLR